MKYKTVLFDLDGTLTDPKIGITSGVQYALARFGINEDRDMLTPFIGPPMFASFKKFYDFDDEKAKQAVAYFREYYVPKGMYESTVFRGVPELLAKLKKQKRKLYVVTLKPGYQAEKVIQYHNLDHYFDGVKGPSPELTDSDKTILIKETLSLVPVDQTHTAVMIGDKDFDIIAAKENGIDSIGVTFGFGSHEEINNAKPTHIVHSVAELEKLL